MAFNTTKAKTSRFGLKTLHYDGANLRNKFYHPSLCKERNVAKVKLEKLLQMHFLDTIA